MSYKQNLKKQLKKSKKFRKKKSKLNYIVLSKVITLLIFHLMKMQYFQEWL